MYYTKTFMIHGLLELSITSCKELKSIEIGPYSFSDYGGEFEMKNLPSLQSITMGEVSLATYNFCNAEFTLQSTFFFIE